MVLKNWKMTYGTHEALPCTAPCTMYSVLLEHGIIDDPFYGLNEIEATALSEQDCVFEGEFIADGEMLEREHFELAFLGLDTICRILVNGEELDNVKNMHRAYTYDIKEYAVEGTNKVRLEFSSPVRYFNEMDNKHYVFINTRDTLAGAGHLRKAVYMSGWDWGPKLPDMGIFRPVSVDAYDGDKIDNIFVRQKHGENKVTLSIEVETRHNTKADIFVTVDGQEILCKNNKCTVAIDNPRLWWVRGYGEQPLYEITARIEENGKATDTKSQKIGLRTLTVSTKKDEIGNEFCFVLNGVKIFAMGANYIPQDNLLSRISPERTEKLIKDAVNANFNCLRIWGGGYYPEDEFYDLCDKYGIMVWQDFMVACTNIWLNKSMREEFTQEAVYNVKRLRHHASLALLCGNNEMELGIEWGIADSQLVREDYVELYERIFPEICDEYAPETFYWPSSPSSGGGYDDPLSEDRGDVHYWTLPYDDSPFTDYRKHHFRFLSEYGFESIPSIKTVKSFCEEEDMNWFSPVMENHQKCKTGNKRMAIYIADNYLYPTTFETLAYTTQLLQVNAIKYPVEHFRRNRGTCMGSLYWQFNDCWPVMSWSSVDCFGRYKALHYAAKKFYAPVSMGLFLEKERLTVNISNETLNGFEGEIRVYHCDRKLNIINSCTQKISVKALKASDVFFFEPECKNKKEEFVCVDLFDASGDFIMRQTELFVPPKQFKWEKPEIRIDIKDCKDGVEITAVSDTFAKGVCIDFEEYDCILSDNFFDLTDKTPYKVTAKTKYTAEELAKSLKIMSVYNIGR